uniref:Uncharacterized protein n=1 Tax=Schlesneria paludicola TaxID=360056 RepID=A0A7C4LLL3_9PLAN
MKWLGLLATDRRSFVSEPLLTPARPVSHRELAAQLSKTEIDLSTVFRNLVLLSETGLVRRIELGDRIWRTERAGVQGAAGHHSRFVCNRCGRIRCPNDGGPAYSPVTASGLLVEGIVPWRLCSESHALQTCTAD